MRSGPLPNQPCPAGGQRWVAPKETGRWVAPFGFVQTGNHKVGGTNWSPKWSPGVDATNCRQQGGWHHRSAGFLTNAVGRFTESALPGWRSKMGGTERNWTVGGTIWVCSDREPQGGWHHLESRMESVGGCHQLPSARRVAPIGFEVVGFL
jgi:hypothetical protein